MKKTLKFFLLFPIIILTMIFSFGCGCSEDALTSISLSLSDYQLVEGYYQVEKTDKNITIDVKLTPSKYSVDSLEWTSSATDVVTVNNNTFKTRGAGKATITASYKNNSGDVVKATLRVWVSEDSDVMSFGSSQYNTTYKGEDIKNTFKILQDTGKGDYKYSYFSFNKGRFLTEEEPLIDAGEYQIICSKANNEDIYCSTKLTINKKELVINNTGNFEIVYGNELPEMLKYTSEIKASLKELEIGQEVYGIGKDNKVIGRYIYTLPDNTNLDAELNPIGLNANLYSTNLYFEFEEGFSSNYIIPENTAGRLNVKGREVVLKISNDLSVTYGDSFIPQFTAYNYSDFIGNGSSVESLTALENEYKANTNLKTPSYYISGNLVNLNQVNCLPVIHLEDGSYGSYEINYPQASANNNLIIKKVLDGKIVVEPRQVVILPQANQSKTYTMVDGDIAFGVVSKGFIAGEQINKFLFVDYTEDFDYLNYKAPVGSYYYKVIEEKDGEKLNPNYIIKLDNRAVKEQDEPNNASKIKFTVLPCDIEIEFNSLTENYKKPNGDTHTLSYFGTTDYLTTIKSLKINNKNIDLTNLESYKKIENWNGFFALSCDVLGNISIVEKTEEQQPEIVSEEVPSYKFGIQFTNFNLEEISTSYYLTYSISKISYALDGENSENFNLLLKENTVLNLNKIILTLKPNMTANVVSKVYGLDLPVGFASDYSLVGNIEPGVTKANILSNYTALLSLTNSDDKYYNTQTATYIESNDKDKAYENVGKYQIFMATPTYKEGMDHYEIVFDTSIIYEFTINPCKVIVTPSDNLFKVYGANDPVIVNEDKVVESGFTYQVNPAPGYVMPAETLQPTGTLSREWGEDVGKYKFNLGSLGFGNNYEVVLDESIKYYEITKRKVTITPNSVSVTYGDAFNVGYTSLIEPGYAENILVYPVFTGNFTLKDASTIAGYYPVKLDANGLVTYYNIAQGTFNCGSNYYIEFEDDSRYTINKKDIIINISTQNIPTKDGLSNEISSTTGDFTYSIIDAITGSAVNNINSSLVLALNLTNDYLVTGSIKEDSLQIFPSNIDTNIEITNCFNAKLGNNVVYNINITILNFEIVYSDGETSTNSVEKVYDANAFNNFKLVCTTQGYTFDEDNSDYSIVYQKGTNSNLSATNVGNYVVKVELGDNGKIVVVKDDHICDENCSDPCESKKVIQFTTLDEQIVDNYLMTINDYGYLNIKKANINYDSSKLGFTESLTYGSSTLTNIVTSDESGNPIFWGANGESLEFRNFDINGTTLNFSYSPSSYSLANLNANNSYPINVNIQDVSGNYNNLNINVNIRVVPKPLVVAYTSKVTDEKISEGKVEYDGKAKTLTLTPIAIDIDDISNPIIVKDAVAISHTFNNFNLVYEDGEAYVICYLLDDEGNPILDEEILVSADEMVALKSFSRKGEYIFFSSGQNYATKINTMNSSPRNAGLYISFYAFQSSSNYLMEFEDHETDFEELFFIYQITKSDEIKIDWKEEYYYTTAFNLKDKDKIPFEYSLTPHFDNVVFTMKDPSEKDWPANNILDVGEYSVNLLVESENYYLSENLKFNIIPLLADFVFPSAITYVYTGEPVDSFLRNIRINQKNINGEIINSFYYQKEIYDDVITITYYNANGSLYLEDGKVPPSEPGNYKLHIEYATGTEDSSTNFKGEGWFEYSIVKKAYTGSLSFNNIQINYSPSLTRASLYNIIRNEMFSISVENCTVKFFYTVPNGTFEITNKTPSDSTQDWFSYFMATSSQDNLQRKISATVIFNDGEYDDKTVEATLTFKDYKINQSEFIQSNTDSGYNYTGYAICDYLIYKPEEFNGTGINLDILDKEFEKTNKKTIPVVVNGVELIYTLSQESKTKLRLLDALNNSVFVIEYKFQRKADDSENMDDFNSLPRDPGKYKVIYNISYGKFYSGTGVFDFERTFNINKVTINFLTNTSSSINITYDSEDKIKKVLDDYLYISNNSAIRDQTNMNVNKYSSNVVFNNEKGVHIYYKVYDSSNNEIAKAINVGSYKIKLTLMISEQYILADYFNAIKYGTTETNIGSYDPDDYSAALSDNSTSITLNFNIVKRKISAPCSINASGLDNIIAGQSNITSIALGVTKMYIEDSSGNRVGINTESPNDWSGFNFSGLEGTYYIVCEIDTQNCEYSGGFNGRLQITVKQPT